MSNTYSSISRWTRGAVAGGGGDSTTKLVAMTAEASTVALWNFDEASGNFIDEVNSIPLIPNGTTPGRWYETDIDQVTNGGKLKNIAPCIACAEDTRLDSGTGYNATLAPAGDMTIEMYTSFMEDDTSLNLYYARGAIATFAASIEFNQTGYLRGRIYASDGTFVTAQTTTDPDTHRYRNGEVWHISMEYDSVGETIKLKANGSQIAIVGAASLTGKTIELDEVICYGSVTAGVRSKAWKLYQLRISHAIVNGYGTE